MELDEKGPSNVRGFKSPDKKHYVCAMQFPERKNYITLEWPLIQKSRPYRGDIMQSVYLFCGLLEGRQRVSCGSIIRGTHDEVGPQSDKFAWHQSTIC